MVEDIVVPDDLGLEDVLTAPERVTVTVVRNNKPVEKEYWIRPPDEMERAMAQNAARRVSRELRELLINEKSEEHDLIITAGLEEMSLEEMRLLWITSELVQKSFEMSRRSLEDREEFFVERPVGKEEGVIPPTTGEMDQYEIDKREAEKERLTSLNGQQKTLFERLKKESENMDKNDLLNVIEPMIVDQKTAEEWNNQYGMQILVRCTFNDAQLTEKTFTGVDQAMKLFRTNSGKKVLEALLLAHRALMVDPDQLKN